MKKQQDQLKKGQAFYHEELERWMTIDDTIEE